ncbi:MAG: glycosyltransferase, partial [Candidatus Krumholzibacteria bacterium]|nr:glycosyltransferase [Candidatus Krumholzibacteria bacterium]
MASVDIIIVNWNTGRQLRECLESVSGADMEGVELGRVVIVDNASSDGSERGLDGIRLPLRIIYNRENRGFAAACNQGALGSCSDYILFLNPDTVLFRNSLAVPVVFMESEANERIGVVGIQLIGDDGQPDRACARFPTPARLFSRIVGLYRLSPRLFPSYRMADWDHAEDREV